MESEQSNNETDTYASTVESGQSNDGTDACAGTTESGQSNDGTDTPALCQFEIGTDSPITLVVEDKHIVVSKAVLSIASPVFKAMIESNFEEGNTGVIKLPGKTCKDVITFLECLYPNILQPVTVQNVDAVMPLAHEYQIECLMDRCIDILHKLVFESNSPNELYKHLMLADNYQCESLLNECVHLISEFPLPTMEEHEKTHSLPAELLLMIRNVAMRRHEVEKEDDIALITASTLYADKDKKGSEHIIVKKSFIRRKLMHNRHGHFFTSDESDRQLLRGLRLTYKYFKEDEVFTQESVKTVRENMRHFSEKTMKEFILLPRSIRKLIRRI